MSYISLLQSYPFKLMYSVYNLLTIKFKVLNNIQYKLRFYLVLFLTSNGYDSGLVIKSSLTLVIPWTMAHQAPLSMGFSRQEYWSGLLLPSPGDLPDPGIETRSPALEADFLPSEPPGKPLLMAIVLMILLLISLSIKQGFKYGQSLIFSFYYRKTYAFLLKYSGHLSALQKLNRADYSYCSIQDCVQLHVIENQTKHHVHTRRIWFVCLFHTSSSSETGCPGLEWQPEDFMWDSAFHSVILHILYLAPLACLQACTEFQARRRKKKKKNAMGICQLNLPPLTETSSKPHSLICVLLAYVQIVLITKDLLVVNVYLSML